MPEENVREEFMAAFNRLVTNHLGAIVVTGGMLLGGCISFAYLTLLNYVERVVAAELIANQSLVTVTTVNTQVTEGIEQARATHDVIVNWRIQHTEDMGKLRTDVEVIRAKVEAIEDTRATGYHQ